MGTPYFATTILDSIITKNFNVVGVITAPDKPAGRGQQISESSVKKYAVAKNLNILQPTNLKDESFLEQLKNLNADLFVVVAFRMLPEVVWSMPPKGTINLHASILPNYRGAAPINRAIMNGETETGVTSFFIEKEIDTGKIIEREKIDINPNETAGELHDRLMQLGAKLTCQTIQKIIDSKAEGKPQIEFNEGELKSAPKIFKPDCLINWNQNAQAIHNFIRGLSPYPTAWTILNKDQEKRSFKIFNSFITNTPTKGNKTLTTDSEGILFPCKDYYIRVTELQPEGKRRMNFKEFLAGNKIEEHFINFEC